MKILGFKKEIASASAALMVIFFLQVIPVTAEDGLSGVLGGMLEKYGNLKGISVEYEREIITKSMAMFGSDLSGDLASGIFYIKPPHFLIVDQEKPTSEMIISNGSDLWHYIPDKKLAYKYPSRMLGKELRILCDIFQGLGSVEDSFDVELDLDNEGDYRLKLIPREVWQGISHIFVTVSKGDYRIISVERNSYGDITRFVLGEFSENKDLKESDFSFVPPKGVELIEENG